MADFILIDGDIATFLPSFGAATVTVQPGKITGSGPADVTGKKICVDGDEKSVEVKGCAYSTSTFTTPGTGTLKIASLAANQKATKVKAGGKAVLLKGSKFTATFEVLTPATNTVPASDALLTYSGQGSFTTSNTKVKAT
ncbi:MAG: hypothetical protein ABIQ93_04955 [Saprospiraceae bacterium]